MVSKLKAWWGLIFNTASLLALAALLADVTGYLAGFQWSALSFVSSETALLIAMGINVANIFLRFVTASAVRSEST